MKTYEERLNEAAALCTQEERATAYLAVLSDANQKGEMTTSLGTHFAIVATCSGDIDCIAQFHTLLGSSAVVMDSQKVREKLFG